MYRKIFKMIAFCSLFLATACLGAQDGSLVSDPAKVIVIGKDINQFTIRLSSTPSTGFSWRLKRYDSSLVVPVSKTYQPPNKQMPGAGGIESFTFIVTKNLPSTKQASDITFIYLRPWDKEVAKTETFKISLQPGSSKS